MQNRCHIKGTSVSARHKKNKTYLMSCTQGATEKIVPPPLESPSGSPSGSPPRNIALPGPKNAPRGPCLPQVPPFLPAAGFPVLACCRCTFPPLHRRGRRAFPDAFRAGTHQEPSCVSGGLVEPVLQSLENALSSVEKLRLKEATAAMPEVRRAKQKLLSVSCWLAVGCECRRRRCAVSVIARSCRIRLELMHVQLPGFRHLVPARVWPARSLASSARKPSSSAACCGAFVVARRRGRSSRLDLLQAKWAEAWKAGARSDRARHAGGGGKGGGAVEKTHRQIQRHNGSRDGAPPRGFLVLRAHRWHPNRGQDCSRQQTPAVGSAAAPLECADGKGETFQYLPEPSPLDTIIRPHGWQTQ